MINNTTNYNKAIALIMMLFFEAWLNSAVVVS